MSRFAPPTTTADHFLIQAMIREGWDHDEAARAIEGATAGIRAQLADGRRVKLDGLGEVRPGKWRDAQPSSRGERGMREISYRHPVFTNTKPCGERDVGSTFDEAERKRRPGR